MNSELFKFVIRNLKKYCDFTNDIQKYLNKNKNFIFSYTHNMKFLKLQVFKKELLNFNYTTKIILKTIIIKINCTKMY